MSGAMNCPIARFNPNAPVKEVKAMAVIRPCQCCKVVVIPHS